LQIDDQTKRGKTTIISSHYIKFEIDQINDRLKRKNIQSFEKTLSKTNIPSSKQLAGIAKQLRSVCTLNSLDALHVAAALCGKANYLLTCDNEILKNSICIEKLAAKKGYKLKVKNPIDYIQKNGE